MLTQNLQNVNPINSKWFITNILCFFLTMSFGQNMPVKPSPARFVNDFAQLLSAQEQNLLEQTLIRYQDSTTTQLVVVTLPDLGKTEIATFGVELLRNWGIGTKERNNGVLILVCTDTMQRQANITTGYGMEGVLPDLICKRILDNHLVPNLQKKAYYQGLLETIQSIELQAKGEYKGKTVTKKQKKEPKPLSKGQKWLLFGYFLFFLFVTYLNITGAIRLKGGGSKLRWRSSSSRRSFGGGSSGGGGASSSW